MFAAALRSNMRQAVRASMPRQATAVRSGFLSVSNARFYSDHAEESFEEFTERYEKEFKEAYDLFEVQVCYPFEKFICSFDFKNWSYTRW